MENLSLRRCEGREFFLCEKPCSFVLIQKNHPPQADKAVNKANDSATAHSVAQNKLPRLPSGSNSILCGHSVGLLRRALFKADKSRIGEATYRESSNLALGRLEVSASGISLI